MIPEENLVFEPEAMLTQVIEYTHYCPNHWKGKLHSDEVLSVSKPSHMELGKERVQHSVRPQSCGFSGRDP